MRALLDRRQGQPDPDVPELIRRAGTGDELAWRTILDLYTRRVFAFIRSRVGAARLDLAEEITQSVFATLASTLPRTAPPDGGGGAAYSERGRFESWLFRIAVNRLRDETRRLGRHAASTDPDTFRSLPDLSAEPVDPDRAGVLDRLRAALETLPDPDREVIELRHHAGLSFKQLSDLLGEPMGTLLARHHRALRKLRQILSPSQEQAASED